MNNFLTKIKDRGMIRAMAIVLVLVNVIGLFIPAIIMPSHTDRQFFLSPLDFVKVFGTWERTTITISNDGVSAGISSYDKNESRKALEGADKLRYAVDMNEFINNCLGNLLMLYIGTAVVILSVAAYFVKMCTSRTEREAISNAISALNLLIILNVCFLAVVLIYMICIEIQIGMGYPASAVEQIPFLRNASDELLSDYTVKRAEGLRSIQLFFPVAPLALIIIGIFTRQLIKKSENFIEAYADAPVRVFCPKCKKEIAERSDTCIYCGTKIEK